VHAVALARELGIRKVLIPRTPGVLSAHGLLMAVPRHDFVQSLPRLLHQMEWTELTSVIGQLEARGRHLLDRAGVKTPAHVEISLDMQYERQNYTLNVPMADEITSVDGLREVFTRTYERKYGYRMDEQPIAIVNCRVSVAAVDADGPTARYDFDRTTVEPPRPREREVYFEEWGETRPCPLLTRRQLRPGSDLPVPCIVEQPDTSVVIPPGVSAAVDAGGMIVISLADGEPRRARGN
jgi:N-methylhydantoinase A